MENPHERIIVSVGGSLLVPDQIDAAFISLFRAFILDRVGRGFSFAIAPGGGKTGRRYQAAMRAVLDVSAEELDWVGIHINNMHAEFLRILFGKNAAPEVLTNFSKPADRTYPIILVGAAEPGHSSDYDCVMAAKLLGAQKIVNLTDTDYVYTADPRKDISAKPIERIGWSDFRRLFPPEWDPGLSSPFDPIAAKEAQALRLEVAVMNGAKLDEFAKYLGGLPFTGTVIS